MSKSKEELLLLAKQIKPPGKKSSDSMIANAESFAKGLNQYMFTRDDLEELIGEDNIDLMQVNHINHFKYIGSLASLYDPSSFVEVIIWAIRTYTSHGFDKEYWNVMLPACEKIVESNLSEEESKEILQLHKFIHSNFSDFLEIAKTTPSFFEEVGHMGGADG